MGRIEDLEKELAELTSALDRIKTGGGIPAPQLPDQTPAGSGQPIPGGTPQGSTGQVLPSPEELAAYVKSIGLRGAVGGPYAQNAPTAAPSALFDGADQESPFIGKSGLREQPPGFAPVPNFLEEEALADYASHAPPSADLRFAGPKSAQGADVISGARQRLGAGPEYTTPNVTNPIGRGLKKLGRQIPFLGALVPKAEAATFKDLTLEDIESDPEMLKRWQTLSQQEKAFALLDGTNKFVDLVGSSPAVWERLMGTTERKAGKGYVTEERVGGAAGQGLRLAGTGTLGATASTAAGAPGSAQPAGAPASTGTAGEPSRGGGGPGLAAGESSYGVAGFLPVDDPREVHPYISTTDPKGGIRNFANEEYAGNAEYREGYVKLSGDYIRAMRKGETTETWIPEEQYALFPDEFDAVNEHGLIAVISGGVEGLKTRNQIVGEGFGTSRAAPTKNVELTEKELEREVSLKQSLAQFQYLATDLRKSGHRGVGYLGKAGVWTSKFLRQFGAGNVGESVNTFMSGGTLSTDELGSVQKLLFTFATKRKKAILNDTRLSDREQATLAGVVDAAGSVASGQQALKIMEQITAFEITDDELEREALGKPSQFPIGDENGFNTGLYNQTLAELKKFGFSEAGALDVADTIGLYKKLVTRKVRTVLDAAREPVGSMLPDEEEDEYFAP